MLFSSNKGYASGYDSIIRSIIFAIIQFKYTFQITHLKLPNISKSLCYIKLYIPSTYECSQIF